VSKKCGYKLVDDNVDSPNVWSVVLVGSLCTPGMITDDSETFWFNNLESEVVGRACGAPDRAV
jgi:hypothetical protein